MGEETVGFEIDCDAEAVAEVRSFLVGEGRAAGTPRFLERRGLEGDAATWIVLATIAGNALPHVLSFLTKLRAARQVGRIKIGDIEIENPTPEQLQLLEDRLRMGE